MHPFDPGDDEESEAVVAKMRGCLYKVELSLHQLPGVGTLGSLNGKSSNYSKLGSPGRTRTYDQSVNSRPLYR